MVRAETLEKVAKYGYDHGVHGKCGISPETDRKMKCLIKNVCSPTFGGPLISQLQMIFSSQEPIKTTTMSIWEESTVLLL